MLHDRIIWVWGAAKASCPADRTVRMSTIGNMAIANLRITHGKKLFIVTFLETVRFKCLVSALEGKSSEAGLPIEFVVGPCPAVCSAFRINSSILIAMGSKGWSHENLLLNPGW
jgi:hypothetical protein